MALDFDFSDTTSMAAAFRAKPLAAGVGERTMPVLRDTPFGSFNFTVDLGDGNTSTVEAGFS